MNSKKADSALRKASEDYTARLKDLQKGDETASKGSEGGKRFQKFKDAETTYKEKLGDMETAFKAKDGDLAEAQDAVEKKTGGGERAKKVAKAIWKYKDLLALLGGIGAIFAFWKHVCDELNGCYEYQGTEEKGKVPNCHNKNYTATTCSCGFWDNDYANSYDENKFCGNNTDVVFCPQCSGGGYPQCPQSLKDGTVGDNDITYRLTEISPWSMMGDMASLILNFFKNLPETLGQMLQLLTTGAEIVGGIIVGMIVIQLFFDIIRLVLFRTKKSQNTGDIELN